MRFYGISAQNFVVVSSPVSSAVFVSSMVVRAKNTGGPTDTAERIME
jgi:hypothetical protein